ncbi:MAG: capsular polysaccharide biosynthesis protein [Pseudorhodobacter sp.]
MPAGDTTAAAAGAIPRRLCFFNAGFLRDGRLRRILALAGHELRPGWPRPGDGVLVWGKSPYAARGEWVARRAGVPLVRAEDAFLRSVRPGRAGDAPLGLMLDPLGVHFDGAAPSRIETILNRHDFSEPGLLDRAAEGLARMQALDLSKYNSHDADLPLPAPGFVLVVDQLRGDASLCGAGEAEFRALLDRARDEHPGRRIVLKLHPETLAGLRPGHFGPADAGPGIEILGTPVSPWRLLAQAEAVYTLSSQLGFEAVLAGHRPVVAGQPFYAGWGLTTDLAPLPRRHARRSAVELFAAAMLLAPIWYDPCRDRLCHFEAALDQIEAETRAFCEDRQGHVALGMRMWKRGRLQAVFGRHRPLRFADDPAAAIAEADRRGSDLLVWAGKEPDGLAAPGVFSGRIRRVEDGFLRSRGLGADLIRPLSLVTDDLGIYYDPSRPSRLEALIRAALPPGGAARARALMDRILAAGVSKYNLGGAGLPPDREDDARLRVLVPGQVEDDASIRLGAGEVRSNLGLLRAARAANPDACLIYKPHPDVEAGLRPGAVAGADLCGLADVVACNADPIALIGAVDEVWTMTSLLGFEALLRGRRVTCLGAPFYAGWGLTRDLGPVPARRIGPAVTLEALAHAALIAYPRYFDPVSRRPCPPEVVLERLATGTIPSPSRANRLLAKLQGRFASHAGLWRRD